MKDQRLERERYWNEVKAAAEYIKSKDNRKFEVALVLGSGLGPIADRIENVKRLPYSEIPGCPVSTAPGHEGNLLIGTLAGQNVVAMQGRFHYYEGYSMEKVVFLIRVMAVLGVNSLILTNAAGGVNRAFNPGDLMIITDHIGFTCVSPLIGPNIEELGPRFNDQNPRLRSPIYCFSQTSGSRLRTLTSRRDLLLYQGPSMRHPLKFRPLADWAAMQLVCPQCQAICCQPRRIRIFGLSCITNYAAGIIDEPLNHEESFSDRCQSVCTSGCSGGRDLNSM